MSDILFFGDSLAKGIVLDETKNRYQKTDKGFVSLFAGDAGLKIANHAHLGSTIRRGYVELEKWQTELEDSRWVFFEFGGNDCDFDWDRVAAEPMKDHEPKTPLPQFESIYADMICKVRARGQTAVMLELPPVDWQKYFAWICRDRRDDNILQWLGGCADFIYRWHELYNEAIHRLATSLRVPLVDMRSAFLARKDYRDYLCADGIHPNERGHRLMADQLLKAWKDGLCCPPA